MTAFDIKARLAEMYPQTEPDYSKLLEPKGEAKPKPKPEPKPTPKAERVEAEPKAQDENDNTGDDEPDDEPDEEQQPEREYFVRNRLNERVPTNQFNIEEGKRWVADHFGPAKQPDLEDVPAGHYASDDVSDEEYAAAYERYTGTAYRKRNYFIKSNRPL